MGPYESLVQLIISPFAPQRATCAKNKGAKARVKYEQSSRKMKREFFVTFDKW
jgi:hypothetical protein